MERQLGKLEDIHKGHLRRYEFAVQRTFGDILDAACGCGYGSRMLWDTGSEVTGIDIDATTIEYARKNYPGPDYLVGDVREAIKTVDWVVSFETIEHLTNPEGALKAFRAGARNLIVSTPNSDFFPFRPESYVGDDYPHIKHYSPHEFTRLLEDCGWEVVERYGQVTKTSLVTSDEGFFQIYVCQ